MPTEREMTAQNSGTSLTFRYLLGEGGLEADRTIRVDGAGSIEAIEPAAPEARFDGYLALPGMPNAHSHAFQRALAGHGEAAAAPSAATLRAAPSAADTFWGWRDAMYRLAAALSPEEVYSISRHAYAEMLGAGYTSVAEFHYLHHRTEGSRGAEMGQAVIEAATSVDLPLLLLPVYYETGGFGEPARPEQGRFVHRNVDDFLELVQELKEPTSRGPGDVGLGLALHSLRAVPVERLPDLLEGADQLLGSGSPIHIHVSEQRRELQECEAAAGRTPIALLADHAELGPRWSLVHATHATDAELAAVREAGATVVLCPITEAYLGDGLFAADEHLGSGGWIAIGSDANSRIDAIEELRTLEYGQRLRAEARARLSTADGLGAPLWRRVAAGGARALGAPAGAIEVGRRADLVVLEPERGAWAGHGPDTMLDAFVVGGSREDIGQVFVGGRRVEAVRAQRDTLGAFAQVVRRQMS